MHRAKKDAAEAVGEAAGVCRHNESQRWLDMRVGSPEDCCRDPPVVTQPPTSSATEESEGAPPLTAGLAAHRPTKHPLEHLYKYKYKGDLLQVVNAPGGSGKTLALATLLAEQEEIRLLYFEQRAKTYIEEVLVPALGISVFYYVMEFAWARRFRDQGAAGRGQIHFHLLGWLESGEPHHIISVGNSRDSVVVTPLE